MGVCYYLASLVYVQRRVYCIRGQLDPWGKSTYRNPGSREDSGGIEASCKTSAKNGLSSPESGRRSIGYPPMVWACKRWAPMLSTDQKRRFQASVAARLSRGCVPSVRLWTSARTSVRASSCQRPPVSHPGVQKCTAGEATTVWGQIRFKTT